MITTYVGDNRYLVKTTDTTGHLVDLNKEEVYPQIDLLHLGSMFRLDEQPAINREAVAAAEALVGSTGQANEQMTFDDLMNKEKQEIDSAIATASQIAEYFNISLAEAVLLADEALKEVTMRDLANALGIGSKAKKTPKPKKTKGKDEPIDGDGDGKVTNPVTGEDDVPVTPSQDTDSNDPESSEGPQQAVFDPRIQDGQFEGKENLSSQSQFNASDEEVELEYEVRPGNSTETIKVKLNILKDSIRNSVFRLKPIVDEFESKFDRLPGNHELLRDVDRIFASENDFIIDDPSVLYEKGNEALLEQVVRRMGDAMTADYLQIVSEKDNAKERVRKTKFNKKTEKEEEVFDDKGRPVFIERKVGDVGEEWYGEDINEMLTKVDPILGANGTIADRNHPNSTLFIAILGATSTGAGPLDNMRSTINLWRGYQEGGETDVLAAGKKAIGSKQVESIEKSLKNINKVIKGLGELEEEAGTGKTGLEKFHEIMSPVRHEDGTVTGGRLTVEQFDNIMKKITGKGIEDRDAYAGKTVPSGVFLGPKIGNFMSNMLGVHDEVTVDKWALRLYRLNTGQLMDDQANVKKRLQRAIDVVDPTEINTFLSKTEDVQKRFSEKVGGLLMSKDKIPAKKDDIVAAVSELEEMIKELKDTGYAYDFSGFDKKLSALKSLPDNIIAEKASISAIDKNKELTAAQKKDAKSKVTRYSGITKGLISSVNDSFNAISKDQNGSIARRLKRINGFTTDKKMKLSDILAGEPAPFPKAGSRIADDPRASEATSDGLKDIGDKKFGGAFQGFDRDEVIADLKKAKESEFIDQNGLAYQWMSSVNREYSKLSYGSNEKGLKQFKSEYYDSSKTFMDPLKAGNETKTALEMRLINDAMTYSANRLKGLGMGNVTPAKVQAVEWTGDRGYFNRELGQRNNQALAKFIRVRPDGTEERVEKEIVNFTDALDTIVDLETGELQSVK